jgi:hypothetical protein
VIVRDRGGEWQVVMQTAHADLSGEFARLWAGGGSRHESLVVAAARHDDGWAAWERSPRTDRATGEPVNFVDVDVRSHLAFYRAGIAVVTDHDPYAGLLVSMHGAGIYRQRYGLDLGLRATRAPELQELVDAFVAEQEAGYDARTADTGASRADRSRDYALLQLFDRLSLYFCMRDLEAGEAAEIQGYELAPRGPWRVSMEPFGFAERPARFELVRRLVPKDAGGDVLATPTERVELTIE